MNSIKLITILATHATTWLDLRTVCSGPFQRRYISHPTLVRQIGKIMKIRIFLSAIAILFSSSSFGLSINNYEKSIDSKEIEIYLSGIGRGLLYSNVKLQEQGQKPLYCVPSTYSIGTKDYVEILKSGIEGLRAKNSGYSDLDIEPLLLFGLIERFPCK